MADEWFQLNSIHHFWMKWRFHIIRQMIEPYLFDGIKILEIGCGNGAVMKQFEMELKLVIDGCDLNENALLHFEEVSGKVFLYNIYDLNHLMTGKYDMILLLDVLEHIENDHLFLETAKKHLSPGGYILIGVPAFNALFSKYDKYVGHRRRYTLGSLKKLLHSSGLTILDSRYWGLSMIPVVILRKWYMFFIPEKMIVKKGFEPPVKWINNLMHFIMGLENRVVKKAISGTSISILAQAD